MDREVFFQREGYWYYYGTYRCVGHTPRVSFEDFIERDQAVKPTTYARILNRVLLPSAVVRQLKQSARAEAKGKTLRSLQCLGLERVGFRQELYDLLISSKEALKSANPKRSKVGKKGRTPKGKKLQGGKKGKHARDAGDPADAPRPAKKEKRS
ncbi:hypothetical protein TRAPUB_12422 [Trametes pubescens]|uniref:Uncharacterized protein n=1 Tax=Trametes pubescens TaxID=154538 RepID=A0A1M2VTW4_TRAPU|nr:hypothetical protein TRAPUB_12422 [Trametes pubescens]